MQRVPSTSIPLSPNHTLVGRSRANDGTCFCIPELKWMFDCGALVQPGLAPTHVFLSHTHSDHVSNLAQVAFSSVKKNNNAKQPLIYLPSKAAPLVDKYLKSHQQMTECGEGDRDPGDDHEMPYELIPVRPGGTFTIAKGSVDFTVQIVECDHRIDCIGFSITQQSKRLRQEFTSLSKPEMKQLVQDMRSSGRSMDEVKETVSAPFLCFLGDTTHEVFQKHPEILEEHHTVIVECTYLDGTCDNAEKYKHMHWDHLRPFIESHPHILFLVSHTSLRYKPLEIRKFLAPYKNVHPLIAQEDVVREWSKAGGTDPESPPSCPCCKCQKLA
jgi:ribonuclease Z